MSETFIQDKRIEVNQLLDSLESLGNDCPFAVDLWFMYKRGKDVRDIAALINPKFDFGQFSELRKCVELGFTPAQMSVVAKEEYSTELMAWCRGNLRRYTSIEDFNAKLALKLLEQV